MAAESRGTDPSLEQTLFAEAYRFDFFQAVRLLERLAGGRTPVGREGPPAREVVRFLTKLSLAFPPSAIDRIERPPESESNPTATAPPRMTVAFLGLTGPSAVLPHVYTEHLLKRRHTGDRTLADFLDLINHRLIALFYRAWEKHHVIVAHERGGEDVFARHLFALIGLGIAPLRDRHSFPDIALLRYAGIFARRHRPAIVLEALLGDVFGLPIAVEQFVGHWLALEPSDCSTIGASGAHNALGISMVLGDRVRDEQGSIRIRLGPLSLEQFQCYLPGSAGLRRLTELVRLFVGAELDFDVQLVLKAEEVPASQLARASDTAQGARLGRFAWLKSRPLGRDPDDAVFRAQVSGATTA
jgi:type VI secretion system protein ImpH